MIEFQGWPKTPRLFRDMIVTEKIDGTNAAIIVEDVSDSHRHSQAKHGDIVATYEYSGPLVRVGDDEAYLVGAQSRKRLITPQDDNFGFARWVFENAQELVSILGPGRHFGEWWGSGIQRGYGLLGGEKRFSLFNVHRYDFSGRKHADFGLRVVPVLHEGPFDLLAIDRVRNDLARNGSRAAGGFMQPEGVVVYHTAAGQAFKALIENDDIPKGEA